MFTLEQELEICNLYDKYPIIPLSKLYNCGSSTIHRILKKYNINTNKPLFTKEQELKICDLYKNTENNTTTISKMFNTNNVTISNVLKKYKCNNKPLFTKEQEVKICNLYINTKHTSVTLSKIYKVNPSTVCNILKKHNILTKKLLNKTQKLHICDLYKNTEHNTVTLSKLFNCSDSTINRVLKQYNIDMIIKNMSTGEVLTKEYLDNKNIKYVQEHSFDNIYNFDFYLPNLNVCIEYQGIQHYKPIKEWGGCKTFKQQKIRDKIKYNYCKENNIKLIEIKYNQDINEVLNKKLTMWRMDQLHQYL